MKLRCGPDWETLRAELTAWHRHFAWRPVHVGPRDCRWLEWVERRGDHYGGDGWVWEYRPLQVKP